MDNYLQINDLYKKYNTQVVLNKVNINIPQNKIFGLLGPNGAGKTSLIRTITQIIAPDSGTIHIKGALLSEKHNRLIGYLPEERGLYKKMKVGEQLLYLAQLKGLSKRDARVNIDNWSGRLGIDTWYEKRIEELSKGMQQKVQFIASVVHNPELLILDEPFSGFDPINTLQLKEEILKLKSNGTTIIFSTHRMDTVEELCDNIALINKGNILLEGNQYEIKSRYKSLTYKAVLSSKLQKPNYDFEIVSEIVNPQNMYEYEIKLKQGNSNDIIAYLISQSELISFNEKIPSMDEIFVQTVNN
ncbi:MAG: ATP-binding cassette domain-containing protein [Bacteroidota bacterium]|nr:ATP-binding cassette domain-containing protein [Bacteroidota bacterium]